MIKDDRISTLIANRRKQQAWMERNMGRRGNRWDDWFSAPDHWRRYGWWGISNDDDFVLLVMTFGTDGE